MVFFVFSFFRVFVLKKLLSTTWDYHITPSGLSGLGNLDMILLTDNDNPVNPIPTADVWCKTAGFSSRHVR